MADNSKNTQNSFSSQVSYQSYNGGQNPNSNNNGAINGPSGYDSQGNYIDNRAPPDDDPNQNAPYGDQFIEDFREKRKLLERWSMYFMHEAVRDFDPNDFKHLAVQVFYEAFCLPDFSQYLEWEKKDDNFEQIVVHINYSQLYSCGNPNIKQFLEYVYEHPNDVIKSIALALDSVRLYHLQQQDMRQVIVRFSNFNQIFPLSMIKSHLINKYVCVRGTVLRVSSIKVLVEQIQFQCHDCKAKIVICFIDGKWETPNRCINVDCRSKFFNPEKHTAKTSFYQRIRIQEIDNDINDINAGKMPKTLDCEIKDDLIDTCISGDIVTICGIMKTELQSDAKGFGGGKANRNRALHASYIDVNSIKSSNTDYFLQTSISPISMDGNNQTSAQQLNDQKMNLAELNYIHKISERRDLFPLLIKSVCPSIFGNDLVKTGIVLSLFGGTDHRLKNKGEFAELLLCRDDKHSSSIAAEEDMEDDKGQPPIRPDIHLLMVGDPGLGKSQMLKHIINVAPRGVYVCGTSTTNAGLTATLVRDSSTNEQNLEAGALVLSDLGVCCIDEFDKMTSDQHTLLEAMEQQTISIAKGGILGSLSARCSVVACANPATGHYNRSRTILENIRISNAILSRFDLVFLMLDDPDLQRDKKLSEHVMRLHSRNRKRNVDQISMAPEPMANSTGITANWDRGSMRTSYENNAMSGTVSAVKRMKTNDFDAVSDNTDVQMLINDQPQATQQNSNYDREFTDNQYSSLTQKIKNQCDRIRDADILQPQMLKKYISYARHTVFPKLSIEACEVLKKFYIALRENASNQTNTLPITSRCLDSLIRLSQARAKLELRSIVTRADALDVVKLVQESIFEACYMEMGIGGGNSSGHGQMPGIYNQMGGGSMASSQMSMSMGSRSGKTKTSAAFDPNNVSMLSIPKQQKFYLERLRNEADMNGTKDFDYQDMVRIGKEMNLQVGDFRTFIDKLNSQGHLLMKNAKTYQLQG